MFGFMSDQIRAHRVVRKDKDDCYDKSYLFSPEQLRVINGHVSIILVYASMI